MKSLICFFYSCLVISNLTAMDLATYSSSSSCQQSPQISLFHNLSSAITATCYEYNQVNEMTEKEYPIAAQEIVDIPLQTDETTKITELRLHLPMSSPQNIFLTLYSESLNNGDLIHIKNQREEIELYNVSRQKTMIKLPITAKLYCFGDRSNNNTMIKRVIFRNVNIPEMSINQNKVLTTLYKDQSFFTTMYDKNSYLVIEIVSALQKLKIYNSDAIDIDEVLYFCLSSSNDITVYNKKLRFLGHLCTKDSFIEI